MRQVHATQLLARFAIAVFALTVGAPFAAAQIGPVSVDVGAGVMLPQGDVSDRFDTGLAVPVGVSFNFNQGIAFQFQYLFGWMGGPSTTLPTTDRGTALFESNHKMHAGTFNLMFRIPSDSVSAYVVGGPGFYHRSVDITTPSVGFVTVCDPWWYICYPAAVSVDQIVGSRSTTDFGFNIGGGATFGHFLVDARFHYAFGPEFTVPPGIPSVPGTTPPSGSVKANGYYIPITIGFRF